MLRSFATAGTLCALLVASTALAQPGGGGRGNRGGGGFGGFGGMQMSTETLVSNADIQKELSISDDQKKQIQTASDEIRQQRRASFQNNQNMSRDERTKAFTDAAKAADEKMGKILTSDQATRVKQLKLQYEGANALVTPDVVTELKITDDEKTKIQKVIDDAQAARRGNRGNRGGGGNAGGNGGGTGGGGTTNGPSRAERRASTLKDALKVLDDDQLVQWGQMTGKEFKFPDNLGFGGFGGGRGNRGNRGGGGNGGGGGGNGGN